MSLINIVKDDDPFARIPRRTAHDPKLGAEGLAVLTYLRAHADGWQPRDSDIRRRFGWGRDKMRAVWRELCDLGYARRRHRVRMPAGKLGTITDVSTMPIFNQDDGSTGGGSPATGETTIGSATTGSAAGGEVTAYEKGRDKEKSHEETILHTKEPAASGGGDKPGARASRERLSLANEFGLTWSPGLQRLLDESRACSILKREGVRDAESARRILGEWSASMLRNPSGDPAAALVWACRNRNSLAHTAIGDERLPRWAEVR